MNSVSDVISEEVRSLKRWLRSHTRNSKYISSSYTLVINYV